MQPINPPMLHVSSTKKMRQCSQLPAGSNATMSGGSNTDPAATDVGPASHH